MEGSDCDELGEALSSCANVALEDIEPSELAADLIADCEVRAAACGLFCAGLAAYTDETLSDFAHCFDDPACAAIGDCFDPLDNLCD